MALPWRIKWADQTTLSDGDVGSIVWHTLHDLDEPGDYVVIEPELSMELNSPGSLTFSILPTHPDYYAIKNKRLMLTFAVYRGETGYFYWAGHPLTIEEDIYGGLKYTCEGVLGYLSDVYGRPFYHKYKAVSWLNYFLGHIYGTQLAQRDCTESVRRHRGFCGFYISPSLKKVITAEIADDADDAEDSNTIAENYSIAYTEESAEDAVLTRWTGKNLSVLELLKTRLATPLGGFLSADIRFPFGSADTNNVNYSVTDADGAICEGNWYLHLKAAETEPISQIFEIGENVLSLSETLDYTDFCTGVVPVDGNGNAYCGISHNFDVSAEDIDINGDQVTEVYRPANSQTFYNKALLSAYGAIVNTIDASAAEGRAQDYVDAQIKDCETHIKFLAKAYKDSMGITLPETEDGYPDIAEINRLNRWAEQAAESAGGGAVKYPYPPMQLTGSGDVFELLALWLANLRHYSSEDFLARRAWVEASAIAAVAAAELKTPTTTIELQVIDLNMIDSEKEQVKIGSLVPVKFQDQTTRTFTVEALKIRLDDPTQNTLTLNGTIPTLTKRIT